MMLKYLASPIGWVGQVWLLCRGLPGSYPRAGGPLAVPPCLLVYDLFDIRENRVTQGIHVRPS